MARIVFLGTPRYGVPALEALVAHHEVLAVVTQPDRPAGRGRHLAAPPVKEAALAHGIDVLQPRSLRRDREAVARLRELGAEVFVLAAFGQILRADVLDIPPHGVIGLHASLLPRWRGAAPVAAAILHGDRETGLTLMRTDEGMDTGDIIAQRAVPIAADDTRESLTEKLSRVAADLLIETLPDWLAGRIVPRPQDDAAATYAPQLEKAQGEIDWSRPAEAIDRQIRAYTPWPGAFTTYRGRQLRVWRACPVARGTDAPPGDARAPGAVVEHSDGPAVATGRGLLLLERVQLAGRRAMAAQEFARGQQGLVGSVLGS